jgi:SHS family lactate transporter-like MFS transporter
VLTTSLFPEHVRARAIGIVYHFGALVAAFVPSAIPWLAKSAQWKLSTTIALVVGSALILMSAAIIVLRSYITPGEQPQPVERASQPLLGNDDVLPVQLHGLEAARRSQPIDTRVELGG